MGFQETGHYKKRGRGEKASPRRNAQVIKIGLLNFSILETRNQWNNNFKILAEKMISTWNSIP